MKLVFGSLIALTFFVLMGVPCPTEIPWHMWYLGGAMVIMASLYIIIKLDKPVKQTTTKKRKPQRGYTEEEVRHIIDYCNRRGGVRR